MKRVRVIFILALLVTSCMPDSSVESQSKVGCPEHACKISSKTAEVIAKGYMCLDYQLSNFAVEVVESKDTYEVRFRRVKEQQLGEGGPIVFLRKSDGERLYTIHSK